MKAIANKGLININYNCWFNCAIQLVRVTSIRLYPSGIKFLNLLPFAHDSYIICINLGIPVSLLSDLQMQFLQLMRLMDSSNTAVKGLALLVIIIIAVSCLTNDYIRVPFQPSLMQTYLEGMLAKEQKPL